MSFSIEKVPGEPIVILTVVTKHVMTEMEDFDDDVTALLDAQTEPVFMVLDVTGMAISLDDLTVGASTVSRRPGERLHHPNVRENLVVTHDGMMKLAVMGFRTATFGNAKIRSFDTPEQALDYCREQIATQAGVDRDHRQGP
jgi:hypothetical protein